MVTHILKDGREIRDISGYVVKIENAEPVYALFRNINRRSVAPKKKER